LKIEIIYITLFKMVKNLIKELTLIGAFVIGSDFGTVPGDIGNDRW